MLSNITILFSSVNIYLFWIWNYVWAVISNHISHHRLKTKKQNKGAFNCHQLFWLKLMNATLIRLFTRRCSTCHRMLSVAKIRHPKYRRTANNHNATLHKESARRYVLTTRCLNGEWKIRLVCLRHLVIKNTKGAQNWDYRSVLSISSGTTLILRLDDWFQITSYVAQPAARLI